MRSKHPDLDTIEYRVLDSDIISDNVDFIVSHHICVFDCGK